MRSAAGSARFPRVRSPSGRVRSAALPVRAVARLHRGWASGRTLLSPEVNRNTHIQDVTGLLEAEELNDVVLPCCLLLSVGSANACGGGRNGASP